MFLTRNELDAVDLEPLRPYVASTEEFFREREHYKLLALLASKVLPGKSIIDLGTHQGDSALALSSSGRTVVSFDVVSKLLSNKTRPAGVIYRIEDLFDANTREQNRHVLLDSGLILIDIDPHEGTREFEMVEWLRVNGYQGIIVLDDIRAFEGVRDNCWLKIDQNHKIDVTPLGHWCGTGIVSFVEVIQVADHSKVIVVSAYIPLPVLHLTGEQYRDLGNSLVTSALPNQFVLFEHPLDRCWLYNEPNLPTKTAVPVPSDRYATVEDNIKSHIIQHNRTEWALQAAELHPDASVVVWLDYGLLKQGGWRNNQIQPTHVREFLDRVLAYPFERTMPFPGITSGLPFDPLGNNWRFCGSTHIWPVKWLPTIDRVYKQSLRDFMCKYDRVPLDLTIWPDVESRCSVPGADHVPFSWYQAEYDASQLLNFPKEE